MRYMGKNGGISKIVKRAARAARDLSTAGRLKGGFF
jgi:hypothetical protein